MTHHILTTELWGHEFHAEMAGEDDFSFTSGALRERDPMFLLGILFPTLNPVAKARAARDLWGEVVEALGKCDACDGEGLLTRHVNGQDWLGKCGDCEGTGRTGAEDEDPEESTGEAGSDKEGAGDVVPPASSKLLVGVFGASGMGLGPEDTTRERDGLAQLDPLPLSMPKGGES